VSAPAAFDAAKFFKGFKPFGKGSGEWWAKRINLVLTLVPVGLLIALLVFLLVGGLIFGRGLFDRFLGKPKPATSSTPVAIAEGATVRDVVVNNTNNPLPDLKTGIYGRVSSDRAAVGVFKEVAPNIDAEIGACFDFEDEGSPCVEAGIRLKF